MKVISNILLLAISVGLVGCANTTNADGTSNHHYSNQAPNQHTSASTTAATSGARIISPLM